MYQIDWDTPFEPAYGLVTIPSDIVVYRGYSTKYPAVSDRPAYFGAYGIAREYARAADYRLDAFITQRPITVLDVRFMRHILRDLFEENPKDLTSLPVILSFGLCSLEKQMVLLDRRYADRMSEAREAVRASLTKDALFEQPGIRVAETNNDAETMGFLQTLFQGFVDGFISPTLSSAFHIEKGGVMMPELILFNPAQTGIAVAPSPCETYTSLPKVPVSFFYRRDFPKYIYRIFKPYTLSGYLKGGGISSAPSSLQPPSVEDMNARWESLEIQDAFKRGQTAGAAWTSVWGFTRDARSVDSFVGPLPAAPPHESWDTRRVAPGPSVPVSPWIRAPHGPRPTRKTRRRSRRRWVP